jgi:hypothetical protein
MRRMTTVGVCVPFRSDDPERIRIFDWVTERWDALHPKWPLIVTTDGNTDGPFNRARAVNRAVGNIRTDIILIADADIMVQHGQAEAIAAAIRQANVPWVVGYEAMVHLNSRATEQVLNDSPDTRKDGAERADTRWSSVESVCGLIGLRNEDYNLIGGNDERFTGWGFEDTSFAVKADTLLGPHYRLPGECLHLFHELRSDRKVDAQAQANRKLARRYTAAAGDPDAMTKLARESMNSKAWGE